MMLFSIIPFQAFAEESIPTSGTCGDNLTWTFADNVLTISGTGEMIDYDAIERPWELALTNAYYEGAQVKVVIEEGVTKIGAYAFGSLDAIHSLELPNSLITIGNTAFAWNDYLSDVTITENVNYIGTAAFAGTALTSVIIPDNQVQIMERAFSQCSNLEKLVIPASATLGEDFINSTPKLKTAGPIGGGYNFEFGWTDTIPAYAFQECRDLESVVLPDTITSIGEEAFYGCGSLQNIELSASLKEVQRLAFGSCYSLKNVVIPDGVKEIGTFAFSACTSLNSVSLPDSLECLGEGAFNACGLTSIVIPNGVKEIGSDTFRYCEELEKVSLGSGIESIGYTAFRGCSALSGITIPHGTKTIGKEAFKDCSALTQVSLPATLETIEYSAFENCTSLTDITIPNGIKTLYNSTFKGCSSLTKAVLPASLEVISGAKTFRNCPLLTAVYFYGDAPEVEPADDDYYASFDADTAVLYYLEGKVGWTSPTWNGYQSAAWEGGEYPEQPDIPSIPDEEDPPSLEDTKIVGTTPVNGATNVGYDSTDLPEFYIQFNKVPATMNGAAVQIDASKEPFAIYRASDDELVWEDPSAELNNAYSTKMVINTDNTIVTVTPTNAHALLEKNTEYYITMGEGYIKFEDGTASPAIEKGVWTFKTKNLTTAKYIQDVEIGTGDEEKPTATVSLTWYDRWFENPSTEYNHGLATVSMGLSGAAYVQINGKPAAQSISNALGGFDFTGIKSYNYDIERTMNNNDIVSYAFAHKTVEDDGTPYELVAVVVKGTSGDEEWFSNFNIGQNGTYHKGFKTAQEDLMNNLDSYLSEYNLNDKDLKFLVTGHSRGAAVSNLTAKKLTQEVYAEKQNIYSYNFATPTVTTDPNAKYYDNIFNINSGEDFVTRVPFAKWGFKHYGIDLLLPSKSYYGDRYSTVYAKMNAQYYDLLGKNHVSYNGTQSVDRVLKEVTRLAPSVNAFYNNMYDISGTSLIKNTTFNDYFQIVADVIVNGLSIGNGAKLALSANQSDFAGVTWFFLDDHVLSPHIFSAHAMATYFSWMDSCTAEELFGAVNAETKAWFKRAIVACPVDVYVYDEKGQLVASVVDEVVSNDTLAISVENGVKTIDLPADQEYSLEIIARDNGAVNYAVEEYEATATSLDVLRTVEFNDISIVQGDELTTTINTEEIETEEYVVVKNASAALNPDYDSEVHGHKTTITGKITSSGNENDAVTITLLKDDIEKNSYAASGTTTEYVLLSVDPGTYEVQITKAGHIPLITEILVEETDMVMNFTLEMSALSGLKGDVNQNQEVNMDDVVALLNHVVKADIITDFAALAVSEVTNDTELNMDDVVKLLNYVVKAIDSLD